MTGLRLALLFLYLPLVVLVLFSFNEASLLSFPISGLTLKWYVALLDRGPLLAALWNSLILAQAVALVSSALGLSAAIGLTAPTVRHKTAILVTLLAPFTMPKAVLGLSLVMMLSASGLARGIVPLGAAHVLMTLPFSIMIVGSALMRIDPQLGEAARDLGATPGQTFFRVTLPLIRPALTAAYSLAAILSISDLTLATYLAGRFQTLSVTVASAFRVKLTPDLNALQTLTLVAIAGVVLANVFRRRH